ncbi:MAG TPA: hypothetical protein VNA28_10595 [Solirubrobacteraceae bacterium]|nr:hypothetical protein [Solirubrobacteraceae bacterium]
MACWGLGAVKSWGFDGFLPSPKGVDVPRKRPAASDASAVPAGADAADRESLEADDALTYAQTRALRRCAPLNSADFKAQRLVVAQQHRLAIRRILRRDIDATRPRRSSRDEP